MSDLLKLSLEAFIHDVNRYIPLLIVMAMTIEHGILCNEYFDRYMLSLTGRRGTQHLAQGGGGGGERMAPNTTENTQKMSPGARLQETTDRFLAMAGVVLLVVFLTSLPALAAQQPRE